MNGRSTLKPKCIISLEAGTGRVVRFNKFTKQSLLIIHLDNCSLARNNRFNTCNSIFILNKLCALIPCDGEPDISKIKRENVPVFKLVKMLNTGNTRTSKKKRHELAVHGNMAQTLKKKLKSKLSKNSKQ
jgi:hypothetical protein